MLAFFRNLLKLLLMLLLALMWMLLMLPAMCICHNYPVDYAHLYCTIDSLRSFAYVCICIYIYLYKYR